MKITNTVLDHDMNEIVAESALYGLQFAIHEKNESLTEYNAVVGAVWYFAKEIEADPLEAIHQADTRMLVEYHTEGTPGHNQLFLKLSTFDQVRQGMEMAF